MPERDENTEAVRNVEKATDSKPVQGEQLLRSKKLQRQLQQARQRLQRDSKRQIKTRR